MQDRIDEVAGWALQWQASQRVPGMALVITDRHQTSHVELSVRIPGESLPRRVAGEVIRTSYKGAHIAHHVRFNDPAQLGDAMSHIVSRGAVALR